MRTATERKASCPQPALPTLALSASGHGLAETMSKLQERAKVARMRMEHRAAAEPVQLFLPGMEAFVRAMPNHIARSSLFAPVARGRKRFYNEEPLITRSDVVLTYTGEQLDESQADVALQLIYEARCIPLGVPIRINRAAFLRAIGRSTGKHDYEWLHRVMKAFYKASFIIEVKRRDGSTKYCVGDTKAFRIVADLDYDADNERYTVTLDPRWRQLFENQEFALIDWNKRLQIGRGQDMAKALQRLIAASADPVQAYAMSWLKDKMQYASPMRKFREAVSAAVDELKRVGVIARGEIDVGRRGSAQVVLWITRARPSG